MLEIDESGGDKERDEDPVNDRERPWEGNPDGKKKQSGEQLDCEIAKRDPAPAIRAFSAQPEPAQQGQILLPRDRFLAGRTKGTPRLVNRKIPRQPVNADVEKGPDRRTQHEGEDAKNQFVRRGRFHSSGRFRRGQPGVA